MKLNVKVEHVDDNLLYKRTTLTLGEKKVITPIKSSNKEINISPINEIYKKFDINNLKQILSNESLERQVNSNIKKEVTGGVNMLFVDYSDLVIPEQKQIDMLSDLQYENSDIVITPTWSNLTRKLTGDTLVNNFISLTNKFIERVKTLNHKSIIGLISSKIPHLYLEPVIKNYYDHGISSFALDLDGRSALNNPTWLRDLLILIKKFGVINESFLYMINSYEGRFLKKATEVPAKDFISIGLGIDVLGLNHIPPRMSSEAWEKIKSQRTENMFRVFNHQSYGYIRTTQSELSNLGFKIHDRQTIKTFNINEQYKETLILQDKLKTENSIEAYVKSKSQVDEKTIKKIKHLRNELY